MNTLKQAALVKKKRKELDERRKEQYFLRREIVDLELEIKDLTVDLWGGAGPDCIIGRLVAA